MLAFKLNFDVFGGLKVFCPLQVCAKMIQYFVDAKQETIIYPNRPITLWDQRVYAYNKFEERGKQDKWGRSIAFCHNSKDYSSSRDVQMYISNHSKDQILGGGGVGNDSECSNRILKQFLDSHYKQDEDMNYIRKKSKTVPFERFILNFEGNEKMLESTLL